MLIFQFIIFAKFNWLAFHMKIIGKYTDGGIRFFKNDLLIFYSYTRIKWFRQRKIITNNKDEKIKEINTSIGFKGIRHIIKSKSYLNEIILKLKGSFTKNYFEAKINNNLYKVVIHKGLTVSFFKNNAQIGYYTKSTSSLEKEDIIIICNSNVQLELIITFITCLELSYQEDRENIGLDFGNIAGEYIPFNKNWKPTN